MSNKSIRNWLHDKFGIWTHSQNLNDGGSKWREGRAWLHYGDENHSKNIEFSWSFMGRHKFTMFEVGVGGDEDDLKFSLGLWFFTVWLSFERLFPSKWKWNDFRAIKKGVTPGFLPGSMRNTGVSFHSGTLWVNVWRDWAGWNNDVPGHWGGLEGHFNFRDILLGRDKYSTETISTHEDVPIPMPEGPYYANVTFFRSTWKRPRWPFKRTMVRADIDMGTNPIPFPGKGENSWDCGEDATYSMTTPATTIHQAVGAMVSSIMRDRIKNGGSANWVPDKKES